MIDRVDYFIVQNMQDILIPQTTDSKSLPNFNSSENKIIDVSTKDFFFSECLSLKDLCSSLRSVSTLSDKFYDVDNTLILEKLKNSSENILGGSLSSYNTTLNNNSIKNTHRG